jgi:predicted esterase
VATAGVPLAKAGAAMLMTHGRGATAGSILELAAAFDPGGVAYLAPQAAGNTWYPQSFLAPLAANEPWLSSALAFLGAVLEQVRAAGIPDERTVLLGFSQGACLTLEFTARNARRYGGVVGLTGGLIGPPRTPRSYPGRLDGAVVFLGCSDRDPHVPEARVHETEQVLARMGAEVTTRIYPGMGHTVNEDEVAWVRRLLETVVAGQ